MSWVSTDKFKTVCESIKNYVIGQADDAYNKAVNKMAGEYLPLTGGTISGDLSVTESIHTNQLRIFDAEIFNLFSVNSSELSAEFTTNTEEFRFMGELSNPLPVYIGEPSKDEHAATKKYVDDAIASVDHSTFLKKTGDTMSGTLDMGENSITNVANPANDGDASNKKYVDDAISAATGQLPDTYVKKSGDTMTGALNVLAPTEDNNATNKKYVDTQNALDVKLADEMTDTELAEIEAIFA